MEKPVKLAMTTVTEVRRAAERDKQEARSRSGKSKER